MVPLYTTSLANCNRFEENGHSRNKFLDQSKFFANFLEKRPSHTGETVCGTAGDEHFPASILVRFTFQGKESVSHDALLNHFIDKPSKGAVQPQNCPEIAAPPVWHRL